MSNRTLLITMTPACERGDGGHPFDGDVEIDLYRDDDSCSFRLFLWSKDSNADLTIAELTALRDAMSKAIQDHHPWTDDEGQPRPGMGETPETMPRRY